MNAKLIHFPEKEGAESLRGSEFEQLLAVFDRPGPRYTSYPTIDHASESVGRVEYESALSARALGGLLKPLSIYVHVPFCESVCYYCACNKVITRKHDGVASYLHKLDVEAHWVAQHCKSIRPVTQFHMGGGTPTFLRDSEIAQVLNGLRGLFGFATGAELSIEIDPRTVDGARLENLRSMGFNRISLGVQDFNPAVQKAVHREQSIESVKQLMLQARQQAFDSINVDLIYGLPLQTEETFAETLVQLLDLAPDRIALYGYAHLPERFKPQRRIHEEELPSSATRVALLSMAIVQLKAAGYEYIGMDHFAKPSDTLAKAKREGRLHRNFQGYSTQSETDLIGLGVSAISKVGPLMVQNYRDLAQYGESVEQTGCAVFRGFMSQRDDLIRHAVIMGLLCQGNINFSDFEQVHWVSFKTYFVEEWPKLQSFVENQLLEITEEGLQVTAKGWFFVRPIAMVFDQYLGRSHIERSKVL